MNHQDHVDLLRNAIGAERDRWADFGSGDGAFTLALRDVLGANAEIISIDKDRARLSTQQRNFAAMFPRSNVQFIPTDFTQSLNIPPASLDGMVMANALHFFRHKEKILRALHSYLKPNGRLVLVEYNVDTGNLWVPYPLSFETFRTLAPQAGLSEPQLCGTKPSHFLREIYSAVTFQRSNV